MNKRYLTPFIDLCLNTLFVFIVLFVLAPKKKQEQTDIKTEGQYVVTVEWPEKSEDDVDTYVIDPIGNLVFFNDRSQGLMHLERDDLGARNDTIRGGDGKDIRVEKNEERVVIRGIIPGEYVVNVHMYRKVDNGPTLVKVTLFKLKGLNDPQVTQKEITLTNNGDERTAFRFRLSADGQITDINDLPRKIIGAPRGQPSPGEPPPDDQTPQEEPQ